MIKIGIASDHAGYEMKEFLVGYLDAMGYEVLDFGTHSPDSVDYADFAHPLAEAIENGELERGIALCGSGEGMTMTLNKHQASAPAWPGSPKSRRSSAATTTPTSSSSRRVSSPTTKPWRCSTHISQPSSKADATNTASKRWRSPAAQPGMRQNKGQNLRARIIPRPSHARSGNDRPHVPDR